nr:uncharacterized protein LOC127346758 [Lolium perenne]
MTRHVPERRYETYWEREASLNEEISCAWEMHKKPRDLGDIMNNLQGVMDHLQKWSKKTIGNVSKQIDKKKKQLDQILKRDDSNSKKRANILCREIDELLEKEELRWRQRSRVNWLQAGDRNTSYFHRKATWRAKKNKITELVNNKGVITQDDKEMNTIATEFFMELYKVDNTVQPDLVTRHLQNVISDEMNENLCMQFSDDEISFALFQIGPTKAPGPDGFPACFYQRNWGTLKTDIIQAVRKFFELGSMPDGVNDTAIVLIPKIKNPTNLKDYRPISLCNVVYKVVVKCLVNRLRPLLKSIVAETQSAFVPERMITDNAIIAFECFHSIHNGNKSSGSFCAYKLDLTKAYDRVDWKFLEEALRTMGFAEQWIKWIMTCVKTVRFSVKFNGKLLEKFYPSRGLRQGDPLSPYLFLLVGESLSALINRNINHNLLQELKISRNCPGISHLMFADDSLLFFRANTDQASRIKEILRQYEKGTGQLLSSDKCSIMFGQHVPDIDMQSVAYILEVNKMTMEDKYLGLPIPEGSMKQGKLISSKDKLRKKCSDWNEKYMSGAAKEALIKSVAQSISNYAMSVFKFPMGLCDDMSQIIREFWWGDEDNKRKVHWLSWDKITKSKNMGGMGFKDLRMFNQALLARQAWRLIQFPESLCARLLKAKYYPSGQLIDTAFSKSVSPCWQGISYGLELLKKGIIWRIGDGTNIRIWRDNWIPRGNHKVIGKASNQRLKWVSDLINQTTKTWDEPTIRSLFFPPDAEEILKINLPSSNARDTIAWAHESNGIFTVRSAYRLGRSLQSNEKNTASSSRPDGERPLWNLIWSTKVPPKLKTFCWKLATNSLGVQTLRCNRNMDILPTCSICGCEPEDAYHAVMTCTKANALRHCLRDVWELPAENLLRFSGDNWVLVLLDQCNEDMRAKLIFLWWRSWHMRNNVIYGDGKCGVKQSALFITSYLDSFLQAQNASHTSDVKGKKVMNCHSMDSSKAKEIPKPWNAPNLGWHKLNIDAGFIDDLNMGSWGAILRDHNGIVAASAWGTLPHCPNAATAEGLAILKGAKAIVNYATTQVIIESDNAAIVQEINRATTSRSQLCYLATDIKEVLSLIPGYVVNKINRAGNTAAHCLANYALRMRNEGVLLNAVPPCVEDLINLDCNRCCNSATCA